MGEKVGVKKSEISKIENGRGITFSTINKLSEALGVSARVELKPNESVSSEANEIDIVALSTDGKSALVAEVKRQLRNYDHKAFMEKVDSIKTSILSKYNIETRLFTLDDM